MLTNNTPYSHNTEPKEYTVIYTFTINILLFFLSSFVITQYLSRSLRQHLNTTSTLILERLNELFTAQVGEDQ